MCRVNDKFWGYQVKQFGSYGLSCPLFSSVALADPEKFARWHILCIGGRGQKVEQEDSLQKEFYTWWSRRPSCNSPETSVPQQTRVGQPASEGNGEADPSEIGAPHLDNLVNGFPCQ